MKLLTDTINYFMNLFAEIDAKREAEKAVAPESDTPPFVVNGIYDNDGEIDIDPDSFDFLKALDEIEAILVNAEESIRTGAYYLWENAGRPDGRSDEFWEQAEAAFYNYHFPPLDFNDSVFEGLDPNNYSEHD